MNLDTWAERVLAIQQGEGICTKIQLQDTSGGVWATWTEPLRCAEWLADVKSYLEGLIEDLPPQDVQLMFLAFGPDNAQLSQCTKVIRGRMKNANPALLGGPGRALADGMSALAQTMEKVLGTANTQLDNVQRALQFQQTHNEQLMQALMFERIQALKERPTIDPALVNRGLEVLPDLLKMFIHDGRSHGAGGSNGSNG